MGHDLWFQVGGELVEKADGPDAVVDGATPEPQAALVTPELFDRVQAVLDSHNHAGEKRRKHNHYLKGTLWCHTCGARIGVSQSRGKTGAQYLYAFCLGRHKKMTPCQQRYIVIESIEARVEAHYRTKRAPHESVEKLYELLACRLPEARRHGKQGVELQQNRVANLKDQQRRLLRLYLEQSDDMPADVRGASRARLQREIAYAEAVIASGGVSDDELLDTFRKAAALLAHCDVAYRDAGSPGPPFLQPDLLQADLPGEGPSGGRPSRPTCLR